MDEWTKKNYSLAFTTLSPLITAYVVQWILYVMGIISNETAAVILLIGVTFTVALMFAYSAWEKKEINEMIQRKLSDAGYNDDQVNEIMGILGEGDKK